MKPFSANTTVVRRRFLSFFLYACALSIGLAHESSDQDDILPVPAGADTTKAIACITSHRWALVDNRSKNEVAIFSFAPDGKVTVEKKAEAEGLGAKLLETAEWELRLTDQVITSKASPSAESVKQPMHALPFRNASGVVIHERSLIYKITEGSNVGRYYMVNYDIHMMIEFGKIEFSREA
jgi:hypothetical protein